MFHQSEFTVSKPLHDSEQLSSEPKVLYLNNLAQLVVFAVIDHLFAVTDHQKKKNKFQISTAIIDVDCLPDLLSAGNLNILSTRNKAPITFRALCDPNGSTPCCFENKCVFKDVEHCRCQGCYDLRQKIHAELSTWIPANPTCKVSVVIFIMCHADKRRQYRLTRPASCLSVSNFYNQSEIFICPPIIYFSLNQWPQERRRTPIRKMESNIF